MTEAQIKKEIADYLKATGFLVFRMQSGAVMGASGARVQLCPPGTPDLLAIAPGLTVWIEVKTPTGKIRPTQETMIANLKRCGHNVIVGRSVEQVRSWIEPARIIVGMQPFL